MKVAAKDFAFEGKERKRKADKRMFLGRREKERRRREREKVTKLLS